MTAFNLQKRLPAYPEITPDTLKLYFSYLSLKGVKRHSALMAGVEPDQVDRLIKKTPELKALQDSAIAEYKEQIDMEIHRRAIDGVQEPVFFKGQVCGHVTKTSDRLLEFMAKANSPEKYREHVLVDANVRAGVLVVQQTLDPDDWEKQYGDVRTDTKRVESVCPQPSEASE